MIEQSWKSKLHLIWFFQILAITGFSLGLPFIPFFIPELGDFSADKIRFWTGVSASAPAVGITIMAPIWGKLTDKFSPKWMLLRALLSSAIILLFLSGARSIGQLILLRVLQGFLTGTVGAAATWVAIETPDEELPSALGFLATSTFIGTIVGPAIGGVLGDAIGYRPTFFLGGIILSLGFLGILFFLQSPPKKEQNTSDESFVQDSPKKTKHWLTRIIFLSLFVLLALRYLRASYSPFLPFHLQELLPGRGNISTISGLLTALVGGVVVVANIVLTKFAKIIPISKLVIIYLFFSGLFAAGLFFAHNVFVFSIFYLATLFFLGPCEPLLSSSMSKKIAKENRGVFFGWQASIGGIGWLLAPYIGAEVSIKYSTFYLYLLLSIVTMALVVFLLLGRKYRRLI